MELSFQYSIEGGPDFKLYVQTTIRYEDRTWTHWCKMNTDSPRVKPLTVPLNSITFPNGEERYYFDLPTELEFQHPEGGAIFDYVIAFETVMKSPMKEFGWFYRYKDDYQQSLSWGPSVFYYDTYHIIGLLKNSHALNYVKISDDSFTESGRWKSSQEEYLAREIQTQEFSF